MKNKTAVQWLLEQIENKNGVEFSSYYVEFVEQAIKMEREQHGRTWDAAIQANQNRGGVIARSYCDFDEYEIN